jgi:hypothetical protein
MRMRSLVSAAGALGLSVMVPTMARADQRPERLVTPRQEIRQDLDHRDDDRDRDRHEREEHDRYRRDHDGHWERDRHVEAVVSLNDVPRPAVDTAYREKHGWPIEYVQYVRDGDHVVYRFRIERRHMPDLILVIEPDGDLLSRVPA